MLKLGEEDDEIQQVTITAMVRASLNVQRLPTNRNYARDNMLSLCK